MKTVENRNTNNKDNKLDENYGTDSCARPDLDEESFTIEQKRVIAQLEKNSTDG